MNAPASTVKVTSIKLLGDNKVSIVMEMVVNVHRLVEVCSSLLQVAAKGTGAEKKK
ncbi:MAG: hypothetical protein NTX21_10085 [Alphaproteobacteria bacterium]|nr:hypothetical protein [Alphaproteobacteria bacterium]